MAVAAFLPPAAAAILLAALGTALVRPAEAEEGGGESPFAFARRACKFRPLPQDLDEGFSRPDGSARVSDTFGLPLAYGHTLTALVRDGTWFGFSMQVPFATGAMLSVVLSAPGVPAQSCRRTWGAGGRLKQCSFDGIRLSAGLLTLTFSSLGFGDVAAEGLANPHTCVSVRVDLEIALQATVDRARSCGRPVDLPAAIPDTEYSLPPTAFTAKSRPAGVVWLSAIPARRDGGDHMTMLSARLTSPSLVYPVQLLLEEMRPNFAPEKEPSCKLRCLSGTPIFAGQVLRHLLPLGIAFTLWVLAPATGSEHCVNFELELRLSRTPVAEVQRQFLGPPAWLCEGAPWPVRLEQTRGPAPSSFHGGSHRPAVLRGPSFALRDVFDLTRPPTTLPSGADKDTPWAPGAGLHVLELQVVEWSVLRVATRGATIPARPVLLEGRAHEAWRRLAAGTKWPTVRVPTVGGEYRHGLHVELGPGEYTLVFALDIMVGGLRPCASVSLRLELEPRSSADACWTSPGCVAPSSASGYGIKQGRCQFTSPTGMLDAQARRAPVSWGSVGDRSENFQITLPRIHHADAREDSIGEAQVLAQSTLAPDGGSALGPVLVLVRVQAPSSLLDLEVQIYGDGVPLAESRPAADGDGWLALAGPLDLSRARYWVSLLHIPQPESQGAQVCVTFSVDLTLIVASSAGASGSSPLGLGAALPGAMWCQVSAPQLPASVQLRADGWPTLLEGEFSLPASGRREVEIAGPASSTPMVVRAVASSSDAEVHLTFAGSEVAEAPGLSESHAFLFDGAGARRAAKLVVAAARRLTPTVCPVLQLHLVALRVAGPQPCPAEGGAASWADLGAMLAAALAAQPVDDARLRAFAAPLRWASGPGAEAPFVVRTATAELRVELAVDPPWVPIEAFIERRAGEVWARARTAGRRLVLLLPSLPKYSYILRVRAWQGAGLEGVLERWQQTCVLVTGAIALVAPAGHDTSNFRQEMLNLPELLAVTPLPPSLAPSWFAPQDRMVASQMYGIPMAGATATLRVATPSLLRLLAEPADLLAPHLTVEVRRGSVVVSSGAEAISSIAIRLAQAGEYTVVFKPGGDLDCSPNAGCSHQVLPFMVTMGLASLSELQADAVLTGSCGDGDDSLRSLSLGAGTTPSWRVKRFVVRNGPFSAHQLPLRVAQPSIVLASAWSPFTERYLRIAFQTEEGVWVGEQRLRQSALEIELPPGDYRLLLEEPAPFSPDPPGRCLFGGLLVTVAAFFPPAGRSLEAHAAPIGQGLAALGTGSAALSARCNGLGAWPLPLDMFSLTGGSTALGGPADEAGRLLIRQRFLLTDIHDGRKKVYLRVSTGAALRLTVAGPDAAAVEVVLEDTSHIAADPAAVFSHGDAGWTAAYHFQGWPGGMWLSFHREHRDAQSSGCAAFDLLLQLAPGQDVARMARCPDSGALAPQELLRLASASGKASGFVTGADFSEAFDLTLSEAAIVEVEVQFNLLLSVVDVRLEGAGSAAAHLRVAPELAPSGARTAPLNARATMRPQLPAGRHRVRVRVEPALRGALGTAPEKACTPLQVTVRTARWPGGTGDSATWVASVPLAPLPRAADLVLIAASAPASAASAAAALPRVAGEAPTAVEEQGNGLVCTWDTATLASAAAGASGRRFESQGERLVALPVQLGTGAGGAQGEVWVAAGEGTVAAPWTGESGRPLSAAPARLWPLGLGYGKERTPAVTAPAAGGQALFDSAAADVVTALGQELVGDGARAGRSGDEQAAQGWPILGGAANLACWAALLALCLWYSGRSSLPCSPLFPWAAALLAAATGRRPTAGLLKEMASVVEITGQGAPRAAAARESYGSTLP